MQAHGWGLRAEQDRPPATHQPHACRHRSTLPQPTGRHAVASCDLFLAWMAAFAARSCHPPLAPLCWCAGGGRQEQSASFSFGPTTRSAAGRPSAPERTGSAASGQQPPRSRAAGSLPHAPHASTRAPLPSAQPLQPGAGSGYRPQATPPRTQAAVAGAPAAPASVISSTRRVAFAEPLVAGGPAALAARRHSGSGAAAVLQQRCVRWLRGCSHALAVLGAVGITPSTKCRHKRGSRPLPHSTQLKAADQCLLPLDRTQGGRAQRCTTARQAG